MGPSPSRTGVPTQEEETPGALGQQGRRQPPASGGARPRQDPARCASISDLQLRTEAVSAALQVPRPVLPVATAQAHGDRWLSPGQPPRTSLYGTFGRRKRFFPLLTPEVGHTVDAVVERKKEMVVEPLENKSWQVDSHGNPVTTRAVRVLLLPLADQRAQFNLTNDPNEALHSQRAPSRSPVGLSCPPSLASRRLAQLLDLHLHDSDACEDYSLVVF